MSFRRLRPRFRISQIVSKRLSSRHQIVMFLGLHIVVRKTRTIIQSKPFKTISDRYPTVSPSGRLQRKRRSHPFSGAIQANGVAEGCIMTGSGSGRISYSNTSKIKTCSSGAFGKSGCRRIIPGQYFAVDPNGRTVMIGVCDLFIFSTKIMLPYLPFCLRWKPTSLTQ